jgi:rsbT co-antagonist protein RsbR
MRITQRQSVLVLLLFQIATALLAIPFLPRDDHYTTVLLLTTGTLAALVALLAAYVRGWEPARLVLAALITLAVAFGTNEPFLTQQASLTVLIPPALCLILASPWWVAGSTLFTLIALIVRAGGQGVYTDPMTLILYGMVVSAMVLARLIAETAQVTIEAHARRAEAALAAAEAAQARAEAEAEARAAQIVEAEAARAEAEAARATVEAQHATIREMSVPLLPISDTTLVMPLIGVLDTARVRLVQQSALHAVQEKRAQYLLLDITGVPVIDTEVAQALIEVAEAARLLGARVALVGVRPEVAQVIVTLGITITIPTYVDVQTAVARVGVSGQ